MPQYSAQVPRHRLPATITSLVLVALFLVTSHATEQPLPAPEIGQEGKDVPWVPTPDVLVDKMLEMAAVTPDDVVIDLGSGDGRTVIAAARLGARAVGVELEENLVAISQQKAEEEGVADRTELQHPLVDRFAHLGLAAELSSTYVVVVVDLDREMHKGVLLLCLHLLHRGDLSGKGGRGRPGQGRRCKQSQGQE